MKDVSTGIGNIFINPVHKNFVWNLMSSTLTFPNTIRVNICRNYSIAHTATWSLSHISVITEWLCICLWSFCKCKNTLVNILVLRKYFPDLFFKYSGLYCLFKYQRFLFVVSAICWSNFEERDRECCTVHNRK